MFYRTKKVTNEPTIEIEEGVSITPEVVPTKDGYTFSGWSEIPETMPDYDMTIKAIWERIGRS